MLRLTMLALAVTAGLALFLSTLSRHDGKPIRAVVFCAAWAVTGLVTTMVAATSIAGDRRRGFFDYVLITPLTPREIVDGTYGAVGSHLRLTLAISLLTTLMLIMGEDISPPLAIMVTLISLAFAALLIALGVACSFAAASPQQALIPTLGFALLVILGPSCFDDFRGAIFAVWGLTAIALPVAARFARRRLNATTVGIYHSLVHVALVSLATAWIVPFGYWMYRRNPLDPFSPAWWYSVALSSHSVSGQWTVWGVEFPDQPYFFFAAGAYALALLANVAYLRWWTIRHFERLVHRGES